MCEFFSGGHLQRFGVTLTVAFIFTPTTNLLPVEFTTVQFTRNIKGPSNILRCSRGYRLWLLLSALWDVWHPPPPMLLFFIPRVALLTVNFRCCFPCNRGNLHWKLLFFHFSYYKYNFFLVRTFACLSGYDMITGWPKVFCEMWKNLLQELNTKVK